MSSPNNANQVLGLSVRLAGWQPGCEGAVAVALAALLPGSSLPDTNDLPFVVVETPSKDSAEKAYDLLEEAGAAVEVERVWMSPQAGETAKAACPRCRSTRTQPWRYAGPGARVNRRCDDCGYLF
jgi:hypothetical protein